MGKGYFKYNSSSKLMIRMEQLNPSDLKAILHSKRANVYYLEYCRVMQKDGRVLYLTEAKNENQYWNIPIANTTVIMLGTGTSITQAAMRMLASAGVLVGFTGGGGTPLFYWEQVLPLPKRRCVCWPVPVYWWGFVGVVERLYLWAVK